MSMSRSKGRHPLGELVGI